MAKQPTAAEKAAAEKEAEAAAIKQSEAEAAAAAEAQANADAEAAAAAEAQAKADAEAAAKAQAAAAAQAKAADKKSAVKLVDVLVTKLPNNGGILTLNTQQITLVKVGQRLQVPEGFALAFPDFLSAPGAVATITER